jgi:epoxyqueuosine reductase
MPLPGLLLMTREEWFEMDEETFTMRFAKSALKRAKYAGLKRNLSFIDGLPDFRNDGSASLPQ